MPGLHLLPGEEERLRLHPATSSLLGRQALALLFAAWGLVLWAAFHSDWWQQPPERAWYEAWLWLHGHAAAAYAWTFAGIALGGAATCLPRGPWTRFWTACGAGLAVCLLSAWLFHPIHAEALPALTILATLPALAFLEVRRLSTHYHVTNLRIVLRRSLPPRLERSVRFADLLDLDVRSSPFPDTGTLIPVVARAAPPATGAKRGKAAAPPPQPAPDAADDLRLPGVRPLGKVRALVELLARRAGATEAVRNEEGLDAQVEAAVAALGGTPRRQG